MSNEAYYKCPQGKGKVMIVLKENGHLASLRHTHAGTEKDD